jgi:outer membrane receptor protein involved in Fe transport
VHGSWKYVGDRFANNRNTFQLPAYSIVDLGAAFTWRGATVSADVTNVFNAVGLTEGNPRVDETLSEEEADSIAVFMGRPVLPRAVQLALTYRF